MLTIWKTRPATPVEAAHMASELTRTLSGDPLHKAFDQASNAILSSLGFGDFVAEFERATHGYHSPPASKGNHDG